MTGDTDSLRSSKNDVMFNPAIRQLQYESDTWKRQLGFIMEEHIHLKSRLAEILSEPMDNDLLEGAESFQNRFLQEDQALYLLRQEVTEFDELLVREIFEDGTVFQQVKRKLLQIRNDMRHTEQNFAVLKAQFNSFFSWSE